MAESRSHPIASTSTGICPIDWHASSRYGTPGGAGEAAHLLGGVDQPAVGGHVREGHEADRPGAVVVEHPGQRVDRHLPVLVVGHHLDLHAEPPPAWSMLTNPLAYSALAVSTRSPGRRPSDQNAWCQANVAFSTRAISSGAAPTRAATSA